MNTQDIEVLAPHDSPITITLEPSDSFGYTFGYVRAPWGEGEAGGGNITVATRKIC